ncbi:predicted protein [Streptomyces filamentosus NRRL 15998]|uniref:Predicted protein n=1 Tax=Streptomyces filamentosus NRRL 15998 TaxID=457431 RepID=D6AMV8_STRFL|nr:predicted protein [Streptomyces filamentosus NRRL 15998]
MSDLHPCALPHVKGIPTLRHRKAAGCIVELFNTRQGWLQLVRIRRNGRTHDRAAGLAGRQ